MIATVLVAAMVLMGCTMVYTRARPFGGPARCPSCDVNLVELPSLDDEGEERRTYDVLVCPHCTNTSTRVLGTRSRFAWCPQCRNRTLETPVVRLPPTPTAPIAVQVDERCHVCGFTDTRVLPEQQGWSPQKGKVIPFPTRR